MAFAPTRILTPIDLVDLDAMAFSHYLVESAADLAKPFDATLVLLHVAPPPVPSPGLDFSGEAYRALTSAQEARLNAAKEQLEKLGEVAKARGAKVECKVISAAESVPETLLKMAEDGDADAIAIASHGRKGIKRLFLGSVAERLAHLSSVPVLLLKPPASTTDDG